jgi:glucuronoarabinoxylan endo-1,4-beta-xylanase
VTNPSGQATVAESFAGGGGSTSYGQTFTVPAGSNQRLQSIYLYAGGGTGTSGAAPVRLSLFDLGTRTAPEPNSYSAGTNLFGAGAGLAIAYTQQPNGVLRLNFTGSDQVVLRAGAMYAFEISGTSGTSPVSWLRSVSDTYTGGAAYRNRAWINGNNARDFALAVYTTVVNEGPAPFESTVDAAVTNQRMDGFGAGVVFLDAGLNPLSDAQMNTLYGTGSGQFGLTLLRVRVSPSGNFSDALENGRKAVARGARILATPWTPPASMKSNNSLINGGSLLPSSYGAYVNHLNGFLSTMAANGAPVSVISLQNEPDWAPAYESASWTAEQFRVFARDFAGNINAPVMMPESLRFDQALSNATLNDPAAAANIDYIGGHLYGATIRDYPLARQRGKPLWQTEFLINDQTIGSALSTAEQINDCITVGNMSAYIWWKTIGDANGLLNASGAAQKRGFVMGQYSRFVRPGDFRIGTSTQSGPLRTSAFRNTSTGRFAIVLINNTTAAVTQRVNLRGIAASSVTPWITSPSQSLQQQSAVAVSGGAFTYNIPAQSVVTFVGP